MRAGVTVALQLQLQAARGDGVAAGAVRRRRPPGLGDPREVGAADELEAEMFRGVEGILVDDDNEIFETSRMEQLSFEGSQDLLMEAPADFSGFLNEQ